MVPAHGQPVVRSEGTSGPWQALIALMPPRGYIETHLGGGG